MNADAALTTTDQAALAAALEVPPTSLQVTELPAPSLHGCTLLSALDSRVRGPGAARMVALTSDGLVAGGSPEAAARVLNACADAGSRHRRARRRR